MLRLDVIFLVTTLAAVRINCLRLLPDEPELLMASNAELVLKCEGEKLSWSFPEDTSPIIKHLGEEKSELIVESLSVKHVGYYKCYSNKTNEEKKIYVYVQDSEYLLASDLGPQLVYAVPGEDTVIPCKPSSPDVTVTLTDMNQEPVDIDFYVEKVGFVLPPSRLPHYIEEETFTCTGKLNGVVQELEYMIEKIEPSEAAPKPVIKVNVNQDHRIVAGENITLECSVQAQSHVHVHFSWDLPKSIPKSRYSTTEHSLPLERGTKKLISSLKIINVKESDSGSFTCIVLDQSKNENSASHPLRVVASHIHYLNLHLEGRPEIIVRRGISEAKWIVEVEAHPPAELEWFSPQGETLPTSRASVTNKRDMTTVTIREPVASDSGVYTIKATNEAESRTLNVSLFVEEKPTIKVFHPDTFKLNESYSAFCEIVAVPTPKITLYFFECDFDLPDCNEKRPPQAQESFTTLNAYSSNYSFSFVANRTGRWVCEACNSLGCNSDSFFSPISDILYGSNFRVWTPDPMVLASDSITIYCEAAKYNYSGIIEWFFSHKGSDKFKNLKDEQDVTISKNDTKFSHRSVVTIKSATMSNEGTYVCRAYHLNITGPAMRQNRISIEIRNPEPPFIEERNDTFFHVKVGEEVKMSCRPKLGFPFPRISWIKDNKMNITNNSRVALVNERRDLVISYTIHEDAGQYTCIVENRVGKVSKEYILKIQHDGTTGPPLNWAIIAPLMIVFILMFLVCIYHLRKFLVARKMSPFLSKGIYNFATGQIESLNPDLDIHEQADLLPYDKKWEFPRDKLKLGKQLGSGAFGVVMKGEAYGLRDDGEPTIVAVKMVKKDSNFAVVQALASELKIMAHLGRHLNVVNLVGACTSNINNNELYVLVEYCRYGNLHNYLLRHRSTFVDQINPDSGEVEPFERGRTSTMFSTSDGNASLTFRSVSGPNDQINSVGTEVTYISSPPVGDDGYLVSRDSEIKSSYTGDYELSDTRPVTTNDLFCWSYQVARGMEYLASRKVLHGDLAARNILLAEGNIVKICDFGFSKSMYRRENYLKTGDEPLPVKWMSIEALRDRIFSTQSDIWAFGIVLWEIFSLAKTPYPGIQFGQTFFNQLQHGYRMEKPKYASNELYKLMRECWHEEPMSRPSFTECAERLGAVLESSVRQHYVDLNLPYLQLNSEMLTNSDYLSMLCAPTFENCTAAPKDEPDYVNSPAHPTKEEEDLMEMQPMVTKPPESRNTTGSGIDLKSFMNPGYEGLQRLKPHIYINNKSIGPYSHEYINTLSKETQV